jgi:hypothetical protein
MATRALVNDTYLTRERYKVASGQTSTFGMAVLLSGADDEIGTAGAASDLAVGVALETKAAGEYCEVGLLAPVVEVLVGTGGATRGTKAKLVADGFTNAGTAAEPGTTAVPTYGIFMQTGVAGDRVGLMLGYAMRAV